MSQRRPRPRRSASQEARHEPPEPQVGGPQVKRRAVRERDGSLVSRRDFRAMR